MIYARKQIFPGVVQYPLPEEHLEVVLQKTRHMVDAAEGAIQSVDDPVNFSIEPSLSPFDQYLWNLSQDFAAYTLSDIRSSEDLLLAVGFPGSRNRPHHDSKWFMYRTASSVTYLNPGSYEGGELLFPLLDLTVRPDVPSTVFFPAGIPFRHQTTRVRSGMRLSLRAFWSDLPPEESHPRVRHLNLG